jgi:hypothetical protein
MYRTPPDFGTWIAHTGHWGHADDRDRDLERTVAGRAGSSADAVTSRESRTPLRRVDIDRIWQRVTLVGRREG